MVILLWYPAAEDMTFAVQFPASQQLFPALWEIFLPIQTKLKNIFWPWGKWMFYPFQLWNICTNTYTIYSCYWQMKNSKTQMFPVNGEIIYLQILAYFHSWQRTSSMTQDRVCKIIGLNFLKIDEKVRLIYNHCVNQVQTCFQFPFPWLTTPRCQCQEGLLEHSLFPISIQL